MPGADPAGPQFRRVAETERREIVFRLDGTAVRALEGDTLLTAILLHRGYLRRAEFTGAPRAGFCLMGACQDCWVATEDGRTLRACTTPVAADLVLVTPEPQPA